MAPFPVPHTAIALRALLCAAVTAAALVLPQAAIASTANTTANGHVAFYVARNSPDRLLDIIRQPPPALRDSHLATLAYGHVLGQGRFVRWEVEGQLVNHWGMQDHWEANVALVARWMHFPWDHIIDTRFAFGEGLSWASEVPPLEPRAGREDEGSVRLLNYLLVEWEFMLPPGPRAQWSVFTRIHHRSGVAGTFGGVRGGSNFVGVGTRYTF
jgi:hypothetical protein